MTKVDPIRKMQLELREGMGLSKCRKCGCIKETLENLQDSLSSISTQSSLNLLANIKPWREQMEPTKYACLGCEHCFPAVAMNIFHQAFPETGQPEVPSCAFEVSEHSWPVVAGEYYAFCDGPSCPVAVSTLASAELAERIARVRPRGLCIVGKTETENIGIDKIIKNTVMNPTIRCLLVAGKDPDGHHSGRTLLSLWENGVDEKMKVLGSPGRYPILKNVSREEVEAFRRQVEVVDMVGCEDEEKIAEKIRELSRKADSSCSCAQVGEIRKPLRISEVPTIQAKEPAGVKMDKAGYFVILPQPEKQTIIVEYYTYDNTLQRIIEGKEARSIYRTVIENGWVTQLSHAAYLGKELTRAELSLRMGPRYVQDGA
jgi:tetrahydromethanopterin S-methyltransferase subunit A